MIAMLLACAALTGCMGGFYPGGTQWDPFASASGSPSLTEAAPTPEATEWSLPSNTEAPTETPTEAPTAAPSAPSGASVSPFMPKLGRLCDGPIFPEPAKYLVVSGESDIFYVYDNMGELVKTFHAVEDEYAWGYPGFFGEDGICENVRISTGDKVSGFSLFDDMIFTISWSDESWSCSLKSMMNGDFEELFTLDEEEGSLGNAGGVLHIDGNYLLLDRSVDWDEDIGEYLKINSDPKLLGPDGSFIRTVDLNRFNRIIGVYGGKYIMDGYLKDAEEGWWGDNIDVSLYTLDGEPVMQHVAPVYYSSYALDDEGNFGALYAANYLRDEDGNYRDKDLNVISELPENADDNPLRMRYGNLEFEDYHYYGWGGVYVGVKDADENWLFRIYNPKLASDHDNERWDDEITGDNDY